MSVSPAELVAQYMIDSEKVGDADKDPQPAWPVYVGHMPETPDNCVMISNSSGMQDGRHMEDGERVSHPGVSFRIRCSDYGVGFSKAEELALTADAANWTDVMVGELLFKLYNVKRLNDVIDIGVDSSSRRRRLFTFSATISAGPVSS